MISHKIFSTFVVFFLIQAAFTKPLDDASNFDSSEEEMRKNPTPSQKLILYTFDNFVLLGQHHAANAVNVSRHILRDDAFMANNKPIVMEFKTNLTTFLEKYESTKNPFLMWDILDMYSNATDYFCNLPEEKSTPETIFIVNILNKYNCKDVNVKFVKEFNVFMDNFVKLFEENKGHVGKPMLDWYGKYSTLTDIEEKIDAFSGFIELI